MSKRGAYNEPPAPPMDAGGKVASAVVFVSFLLLAVAMIEEFITEFFF